MKQELAFEIKKLVKEVTEKEIKRNRRLKTKTNKLKRVINALLEKGERQ